MRSSVGWDHTDGESIERAGRAGEQIGRDLSVARGRSQVGISEQNLNDANVDPAFQEMGRKRVPERMDSNRLGNPSAAARGAAGRLDAADADMFTGVLARK